MSVLTKPSRENRRQKRTWKRQQPKKARSADVCTRQRVDDAAPAEC